MLLELGLNRVIEVDVDSHELLRVNGEEVSGIEHKRVLDLSDEGERWEGDVLNDEPYGWGVLYDSENRVVYEGFRIGEVNVCYGRSYFSDIQQVEYEGMICEGKRWGRGVQYDRSGDLLFNGEWMNDDSKMETRVVIASIDSVLHNHIEELIVSDGCGNEDKWLATDFSLLIKLRELIIGDKCFMYLNEVKLVELNQLERVMIGNQCFTKEEYPDYTTRNPNRHFYLKNCERLRELKIGRWSFFDYSVCEIENLPSLELIEMGELDVNSSNFCYASKLKLTSSSKRL